MNETLLTWIIFIIAFGGMVIIHEFGHFIVARLCNIDVEEFGIGLPTPGAITLFTWRGTRFTLNWLPLGGFVRPKGENDPTVPGGLAAANPWKRFVVLVAGPSMNLLTAIVVYSFIFARVGMPDTNRVLVTNISAESPAAQAGFESGDIFVRANGQPINNYDDLRAIVDASENAPVVFLMDRRGEQIELIATPKYFESEERVMIGVGLGMPYTTPTSLVETIQFGARYTYLNTRNLLSLPAQLIRGTLTPEQSRVVGLKGIYDIMEVSVERGIEASEAAPASQPFDWYIPALEIVAALSISLGIFNLFPFPALDGGRIIFLLPELIFRRRVPARVENLVHGLGMTFLLLFMIYVNVMDFVNPLNLTAP
jgi:regulator of sigma E protease